jgi:peptidyl-prolyl cis-trans isomerase SurA
MIKNVADILVLKAFKEDIKNTNKEYNALMEEYKNGIMIFSLSEKYIWNKASEDSLGLLAYFNLHQSDFYTKKTAKLRTIYTNDLQQATTLYKYLSENKPATEESLRQKMKSIGIAKQKIETILLEEGANNKTPLVASITQPMNINGKYCIKQVYDVVPGKPRTLSECRGYVVAAYQQQLEKDWLNDLKKKYPVEINKDVFESMLKVVPVK